MERNHTLEFLPKRFFHQTKLKSFKLRESKNSGFVTVFLLPVIALMMTAIIGFSLLSVGIKNITKAQSHCIITNLKGQKRLGLILKKILKLNKTILFIHNKRKIIEASITTASLLGFVHSIPFLKSSLNIVKQAQNLLMVKQKYLLSKSLLIKRNTFRKFKNQLKSMPLFHVKDNTFLKKALALKKEKIGDKAYTYKPVPDFINHQKIQFSWKMKSFFPLHKKIWQIAKIKPNALSNYTCTSSLEKKGTQWISTLYY